MGCNLNEISQCTNKCDCGDLNTLMFKGTGKTEIESEKQKKLNIMRKYNENKNIFQITRENDISKNVFSVNITDNNDTNKQENQNKEQKNVKICFQITNERFSVTFYISCFFKRHLNFILIIILFKYIDLIYSNYFCL